METEFSVNISKLRKERGLNQRKAASELEISQALLSHYENGIREPGLDFVIRVCDYYGVSADFILGRTNIRETVLIKETFGPESAGSSLANRLKQEALTIASAMYRIIAHYNEDVAVPALNYIASSEYRLLSYLIASSDPDLISSDRKKADILSEIDMKLLCLTISEEMAKQSNNCTADIIRKNVSKPTFKSFETALTKTEERLTTKTDKK